MVQCCLFVCLYSYTAALARMQEHFYGVTAKQADELHPLVFSLARQTYDPTVGKKALHYAKRFGDPNTPVNGN